MGREIAASDPTRRSILKIGIVVAGTRLLDADAAQPSKSEKSVASYIVDQVGIPKPSHPSVGLNADGLPVVCHVPNGKDVPIDHTLARYARREALRTGEPQVVKVVRFSEPTNPFATDVPRFTKDHPEVKGLPEDVLSPEELQAKGVEIINTDSVKLHIRKSAFAPDGPLAVLNNPRHKLTIVLVDGPLAHLEFLQKTGYDNVRDALREQRRDMKQYRKLLIRESQALADSYKKSYRMILNGTAKPNSLLDSWIKEDPEKAKSKVVYNWIRAIGEINGWRDEYPDSEVFSIMVQEGILKEDSVGLHAMSYNPTKPNKVFVAVGDTGFDNGLATIAFAPDGTCQLVITPNEQRPFAPYIRNMTPLLSQTHPDPGAFLRNPAANPSQPDSYPYAGQTSGFALRHELQHEIFHRTQDPRRESEYWTDELAMQGIRNAWKEWIQRGDDRGYCFVYETPQGYLLI